MTLETFDQGTQPRLVECPFCGAELDGGDPDRRPAHHLRECAAFQEAWGDDPREREEPARTSRDEDFPRERATERTPDDCRGSPRGDP